MSQSPFTKYIFCVFTVFSWMVSKWSDRIVVIFKTHFAADKESHLPWNTSSTKHTGRGKIRQIGKATLRRLLPNNLITSLFNFVSTLIWYQQGSFIIIQVAFLTCTSPGKNTTCCWASEPQNTTSFFRPSCPCASMRRTKGKVEDLSIKTEKLNLEIKT